MPKLIGHGPSQISIIQLNGTKVIRKFFPATEADRLCKEATKMCYLRIIGNNSQCFKVPKVLSVDEIGLHYTMEFIDAAPISNTTSNITTRVMAILDVLGHAERPENGVAGCSELWKVMLLKFKAAKTNDERYFDIINQLPEPQQLPKGYSHGDLTFDNILCDKAGNWYLIDPSWSAVESPLWDVGKLLQSTAANWENIKSTGKIGKKSEWLDIQNRNLLKVLVQSFTAKEMLIGLACQLARVSRWCFADELVRVVKVLLETYLRGDADECLDALCGIV